MENKNLHQIYITENNEPLPDLLLNASKTFINSFPGYKYTLYNREMLEDFIRDNIGKEAIEAFYKLRPYAYKADFGSYCLMYKLGGWYSDISIRFLKGIKLSNCDFLGFIDRGGDYLLPNAIPYPIQSSFFYSEGNSRILAKAIDLVIENCYNKFYGRSANCPTGSGVLGRAYAITGGSKGDIFGEFKSLTPNYECKNTSYILPNGEIIALHKFAWNPQSKEGDLKSLGGEGTNNFIKIYDRREIYHSEESFIF